MLLFSSLLLPTFFFFPFTLLYFNAFHFFPLSFHVRYFHVLPLSAHILSMSLHAMSKSSQIEYSECMTLATLVVTIYMCEYWKKQIYTHTKAFSFVFVPFPFHFCSHFFHAFLLSCEFPFTSFHVPSISVNHIVISRSSYWNFAPFLLFFHVLLMFLWFSFPFVSFSFSSSFHVPFILLSCHFSFLPFFLQVMPFSLYVLSFKGKNRISAHVRFIFFS
jgi:hypothetical protein